ncbi:MAG: hypothetical protein JF595_16225 [Sphingomonadales bacterium]|nr:hypothetical protein [Sphingomonadales bacterium]
MAALLALGACQGPGSVQEANAKVATFHQRLDDGDFEAIWCDCGPDIQTTDKQAFARLLASMHGKLGNVRTSKQTGWRSQVDTTGSFTELTMETTFERGSGEESFVYKGSGAKQKLAGYHIRAI